VWEWITQTSNAYPYLAYLILFIGTFAEGETILILIAMLARDGTPNIWLAILSAFAGSLTGDQTWFYLGRLKGKQLLAKRPLWQHKADKVYRILERHSTWLVLGFRFLYGLRNVTPFALGMSNLKAGRFLLLNAIGAAVWALAFGLGGYKVGEWLEASLKKDKYWVLAGFCALIIIVWTAKVYFNRRKNKTELAQLQAPSATHQADEISKSRQ
jgi:membrane protein DedA with SNARE-associated domain